MHALTVKWRPKNPFFPFLIFHFQTSRYTKLYTRTAFLLYEIEFDYIAPV